MVKQDQEKNSVSSNFSIDPEFEESLQKFRYRLDCIYKHPAVGYEPHRLIPNVSKDWLKEIRRKNQGSKSKSTAKMKQEQLKVQAPLTPSSPQALKLKNCLSSALGAHGQTLSTKLKSNSDNSHTQR